MNTESEQSEFSEFRVTVTCGRKFHSDHVAAALMRRGALERVVTANPPAAYRRYDFPNGAVKHTLPYYLPGLGLARLGWWPSLTSRLDWWASRRFDEAAARNLGDARAVIAWAWSALKTLTEAKRRGMLAVLEECGSANAHQEKVLEEEHERLGLPKRVGVSQEVIDNERAECEVADVILCPSRYVADSLSIYGIGPERCLVLPYAVNPQFSQDGRKPQGERLRILFVGSVGPRKGIVYLLRALRQLPKSSFECTVIGRVDPVFEKVFAEFLPLITHIPSVPHAEISQWFQWASVFVLPTLDEGMAYVITEALASGAPVITTPPSGALDTVIDGWNGFIVPVRDDAAILKRLDDLATHPDLFEAMSDRSAATVMARTWGNYVDQLINYITDGIR